MLADYADTGGATGIQRGGVVEMRESAERVIKVGFRKSPKKVFDEIEQVTAEMIRAGWVLRESCLEDGLGNVHLFFERDLNSTQSEIREEEHAL